MIHDVQPKQQGEMRMKTIHNKLKAATLLTTAVMVSDLNVLAVDRIESPYSQSTFDDMPPVIETLESDSEKILLEWLATIVSLPILRPSELEFYRAINDQQAPTMPISEADAKLHSNDRSSTESRHHDEIKRLVRKIASVGRKACPQAPAFYLPD